LNYSKGTLTTKKQEDAIMKRFLKWVNSFLGKMADEMTVSEIF